MARIFLVREADAGGRYAWPGPDRLRPLTGSGWREARVLARRMDGMAITRIVSSPWLRCQQTVLPLAEANGLPIDSEAGLGQIASVGWALRLAAEAADGTVVCTHPDLLYALIEELRCAGGRVRPLCGLAWSTQPPTLAGAAIG